MVTGCTEEILYELEPWCSNIYVDSPLGNRYTETEQSETDFDLHKRVIPMMHKPDNDIVIEFNARDFNQERFNIITSL